MEASRREVTVSCSAAQLLPGVAVSAKTRGLRLLLPSYTVFMTLQYAYSPDARCASSTTMREMRAIMSCLSSAAAAHRSFDSTCGVAKTARALRHAWGDVTENGCKYSWARGGCCLWALGLGAGVASEGQGEGRGGEGDDLSAGCVLLRGKGARWREKDDA